jgi:YHS domain-containing protein
MKTHVKSYGALLCVTALIAVSGVSCSQPAPDKPYDSVVVDRSNPEHTVVEFNGACAAGVQQGKYDIPGVKQYSVTQNGKTYYFSSASARDHFMQNFAQNSKQADQMWLTRSETETSGTTAANSIH